MKKLLSFTCLITLAFSAYSQTDSARHKVSLKLTINAIEQPVSNKYYGTSYGIGGLGAAYHFSSKYSVELNGLYSKLTMIDPKDRVLFFGESFAPLPIYDSPYFSFNGGDLTLITIVASFRYDLFRHTHFHIYANAGPGLNLIRSDAITGYDVRQQNNPTIYTAEAALSETALGANAVVGTAFYFSNHFNLFAETGYSLLFFNKTAKYLISPSSISVLNVKLGLEYAF